MDQETRAALLIVRCYDPDGWETRQPTQADYDSFARWVENNYGLDILKTYLNTNWDE